MSPSIKLYSDLDVFEWLVISSHYYKQHSLPVGLRQGRTVQTRHQIGTPFATDLSGDRKATRTQHRSFPPLQSARISSAARGHRLEASHQIVGSCIIVPTSCDADATTRVSPRPRPSDLSPVPHRSMSRAHTLPLRCTRRVLKCTNCRQERTRSKTNEPGRWYS